MFWRLLLTIIMLDYLFYNIWVWGFPIIIWWYYIINFIEIILYILCDAVFESD